MSGLVFLTSSTLEIIKELSEILCHANTAMGNNRCTFEFSYRSLNWQREVYFRIYVMLIVQQFEKVNFVLLCYLKIIEILLACLKIWILRLQL